MTITIVGSKINGTHHNMSKKLRTEEVIIMSETADKDLIINSTNETSRAIREGTIIG
jgi:hypothetical protein